VEAGDGPSFVIQPYMYYLRTCELSQLGFLQTQRAIQFCKSSSFKKCICLAYWPCCCCYVRACYIMISHNIAHKM
jgi:hypothetical protein